jgi:hypothetical protein
VEEAKQNLQCCTRCHSGGQAREEPNRHLVAAPREWLGPALVGIVPVAVFAAYRKWLARQQAAAGPPNVWIDGAGLHWLDAAGQAQMFARQDVHSFRIGCDDDTTHPVPALTLSLAGGFESQPIELHPPATPNEVRRLLVDEWNLPELPAEKPRADGLVYDLALDVYSECHDDFQEWHLEGSRRALGELFAAIGEAGRTLPEAPPGAKPARRVFHCRRREASQLRVGKVAAPDCGDDRIGGPAEWLERLSRYGAEVLENLPPGGDDKFDLALHERSTWTFHLHVREP